MPLSSSVVADESPQGFLTLLGVGLGVCCGVPLLLGAGLSLAAGLALGSTALVVAAGLITLLWWRRRADAIEVVEASTNAH